MADWKTQQIVDYRNKIAVLEEQLATAQKESHAYHEQLTSAYMTRDIMEERYKKQLEAANARAGQAEKAAKVMNDENQGLVDDINKHLGHLGTHSPKLLVREAAERLEFLNSEKTRLQNDIEFSKNPRIAELETRIAAMRDLEPEKG